MITNDELLEWVNSMPLWFRKATELYYSKKTIADDDIKKLADFCLQDDADYKVKGINLINHGQKKNFAIKSIDEISGVNANSSRKPLVFGESGITVVYGLNGAGKSGYIRILKMISGAKYREEIKNNIYTKDVLKPKARMIITDDEGEKEFDCDLKQPGQYEELRNIDIFDTKISNAYVNEANGLSAHCWQFADF